MLNDRHGQELPEVLIETRFEDIPTARAGLFQNAPLLGNHQLLIEYLDDAIWV